MDIARLSVYIDAAKDTLAAINHAIEDVAEVVESTLIQIKDIVAQAQPASATAEGEPTYEDKVDYVWGFIQEAVADKMTPEQQAAGKRGLAANAAVVNVAYNTYKRYEQETVKKKVWSEVSDDSNTW